MKHIKFIREGGTATWVRMIVDGKNNGVYLRKQFPGFSSTFTFYPDDLDLEPSYNSREQERLEKLFQMYLKELKDEQLLKSLQGTMATIDPYSVKKEAIDEYRIDTVEERLTRIEDKVDLLITQLKIEFYKKNDGTSR
jgi:hypothetical protein